MIVTLKILYIIMSMWIGYLVMDFKTNNMQSKFLTVGVTDFLHGLFVAVAGAVLTIVTNSIQSGSLTFDFKAIGTTALIAGLSYISKKFLSNNQGEILTPDSK